MNKSEHAKINALDVALKLLSRSSHSETMLKNKLYKRGYGEKDILKTVDRLKELNLINDETLARELSERMVEDGVYGKHRIKATLIRRGFAKEEACRAVEAAYPKDERERIGAAADKYLRTHGIEQNKKSLMKMASKLRSMGYGDESIIAEMRSRGLIT